MRTNGAVRQKKKGTSTSAFGSPGRVAHDSSTFYKSRLYEGMPKEDETVVYHENPVPPGVLDSVVGKSSERMDDLPDDCIHLMVTSPPYNVGKEYDENLTLNEYRMFLKRVWAEVKRVLVPGGRVAINVANLGRKPYLPLHSVIIDDMLDLGYLMRGELIWNKAASSSPSTAWGTFASAKNPTLRDVHEYILVFSKGSYSREVSNRKDTITREEFMEFTKSVWTFPAEPATKVGHPAPFPVELPYRLIQFYTYEGDVVLDPFMGSGQTGIAAVKSRRHYVGYEINEEYIKLSRKRIKHFSMEFNAPKITEFDSSNDNSNTSSKNPQNALEDFIKT
ncbi:MAG: site-specific DNA-methyltransferase [Euryarchaeota archaeon]|nr:site-specific DNA-methyltransferase [Euryarchaeota archaeon]